VLLLSTKITRRCRENVKPITENHIEQYAIEELQALGYGYVYGPEIEREDFGQVVLIENLRRQVAVINPDIPDEAREQAVQKVLRIFSPDLLTNNEQFHQLEKIKVPYTQDGFERSHEVALIDFGNIENNDFLAVNQFTVTHNNRSKRIDVLLFVNGIPLVLMELKNATGKPQRSAPPLTRSRRTRLSSRRSLITTFSR
jgi:type I restriction enzyme, R subunit